MLTGLCVFLDNKQPDVPEHLTIKEVEKTGVPKNYRRKEENNYKKLKTDLKNEVKKHKKWKEKQKL